MSELAGHNSNHRPEVDFYQTPATVAAAAEVVVMALLVRLVKKEALSKEEAIQTFNDASLVVGRNNAHQLGHTLENWKKVFEWKMASLEEQAPSPSKVA